MKKILAISLLLFVIAGFSFVESPYCEEEVLVPPGEWTIEELHEGITEILQTHEEILEYITDLKAAFDEDGEIMSIAYKIEDLYKDIKELDKDTLLKIYHRIANERIRIMTEKRARQLKVIDRTSLPNVPTVPKTPVPPPPPPRLPEIPTEVPSVPERR